MKILHTADWHAGRTLKGQDRTPEIKLALQEIADLAIHEEVALVLVAGDIFDKKNPSAEAEAAVYDFFLTLARAKIPSVVIAGNHDAPSRLEAASGMLSLAGAHVFGDVRTANDGGSFELKLGNEVARIAVLPFISERRIVRFEEIFEHDVGVWLERYRTGMRKLIGNVCQHFSSESINLLMLHTTMDGAMLSNSEYKFHCTESYSISADMLPDKANYVALGHIHKAQPITGYAASSARYAGSLIQLDFGEAGDKKYAFILEAKAGKPTEVLKRHEVKSGRQLKVISTNIAQLDKELSKAKSQDAWFKLSLSLEQPIAGLKDRIMREAQNVLDIELKLPEHKLESSEQPKAQARSLSEAFVQFYQEEKGQDAPPALLEAFRGLLEQQNDSRSELLHDAELFTNSKSGEKL